LGFPRVTWSQFCRSGGSPAARVEVCRKQMSFVGTRPSPSSDASVMQVAAPRNCLVLARRNPSRFPSGHSSAMRAALCPRRIALASRRNRLPTSTNPSQRSPALNYVLATLYFLEDGEYGTQRHADALLRCATTTHFSWLSKPSWQQPWQDLFPTTALCDTPGN
jgi:hypothetical protein